MNDHIEQVADELTAATRQGDMPQAYRVIQGIAYQELPAIALAAGFSCVSPRNKRAFLVHLQQQVAEAARRRTDGYGLRSDSR